MEIVKTLHVKFFPFGSVEPVGSVTVKFKFEKIKFLKIFPIFSPNYFSIREIKKSKIRSLIRIKVVI